MRARMTRTRASTPRHPPTHREAPTPVSTRRARPQHNMASPQSQDPETTNLYVGNLAASVTEEVLFREFQKFGPIQSVKVRQLRLSCAAG